VTSAVAVEEADLERRFGGLRRLYGDAAYTRLRRGRVAVVGLGGVGSWAVEALARCGVAALVLIDLDHVAESNINRQVQALGSTLGQAKGEALRVRISDIHPGCAVHLVDDFVTPDNWPVLLSQPVDVLLDACDQVRAKAALAAWGAAAGVPVVSVGAAGGKRQPERVEVADLRDVTHDPLLAALRQRLRQGQREQGALPRPGAAFGLRCVFSREPVVLPQDAAVCITPGADPSADPSAERSTGQSSTDQSVTDGSLNCHGYGSVVTVTATFGLVAANEVIAQLLRTAPAATPERAAILEGLSEPGARPDVSAPRGGAEGR
jgi:tRNA A37 threonylcarbamoyladenosine dehydratase